MDFNVPIKEETMLNGQKKIKVANDFKIKAQLETISYLLKNGAKVLLVSHLDSLGSFLPIIEEIGVFLGQTISLIPHSKLSSLDTLFQSVPVFLFDNIRQDKREEENREELALSLSKGFDFFINDAFAVSHRVHALVVAVTKFLPSFGGFLMKKEITNLSQALAADVQGKVLVLGGAKISTKLPVIENFLDKAEKIIIGGALANDFWQAQGMKVGASLVDDSVMISEPISKLSSLDGTGKIILPTDILISKDKTGQGGFSVSAVKNLNSEEIIVDIGPQSAQNFAEIIKKAELVIWNGPMGLLEVDQFFKGTEIVAMAVAQAKKSIIGGGETIEAVAKIGLLDKFHYVSTGGGAMLEFLSGNRLPGLEALGYYN